MLMARSFNTEVDGSQDPSTGAAARRRVQPVAKDVTGRVRDETWMVSAMTKGAMASNSQDSW